MAETLRLLKGHSNSKVFLLQDDNKIFVQKVGDVGRNLERYVQLEKLGLNIPQIYNIGVDCYDMEYIHNLDVKTLLSGQNTQELSQFICDTIGVLSNNSVTYDYSVVYHTKLDNFDFSRYNLPFTKEELFEKLPKVLPKSQYHGDFTLENILYDTTKKQYVLIDPLTTEYDSYVFDLAKLRQDLICKWFIRNDNVYFDSKLKTIYEKVKKFEHSENDYLLILMLMRVLPYTHNEKDEKFLINEVNKLWK